MEPARREQFLRDYATIRHAEGRGSGDPAYYRALPFTDITGRNQSQWDIRGRSFRALETSVLPPFERAAKRPLRILDLGAGTGWLAWRLQNRGHQTFAVDIFTDPLDGLGAARHFPVRPNAVAAEFDSLPFPNDSIDVAIFNASIHYSPNYHRTLTETRRILQPTGAVIIIDSPVYTLPQHGETMRNERQVFFERTYGFRSDALNSIEYLDEQTLAELSRDLGVTWQRTQPWYGWKWAWRPWRARLRRQRPPSRFMILTGRFRQP